MFEKPFYYQRDWGGEHATVLVGTEHPAAQGAGAYQEVENGLVG